MSGRMSLMRRIKGQRKARSQQRTVMTHLTLAMMILMVVERKLLPGELLLGKFVELLAGNELIKYYIQLMFYFLI